jgi:hypothetical protein
MKVLLSLALALSLAPLGAGAAPVPTAAPSARPTPDVPAATIARAKDWLHRLQTANIDRAQLTPKMQADLAPAAAKHFAQKIGPFGTIETFAPIEEHHISGNTAYVFDVGFQNGTTAYFVFETNDTSAKISGLNLKLAE